ncbi:MAG: family 78 glycoside hydrolase catalytic domain [Oscillospiraceae bacterium]|jgi:alpha-L-rhamnosidase
MIYCRPVNLKCEYVKEPLGLDIKEPRLSWEVVSDVRGMEQTAYRVEIFRDGTKVWDSGKVESSQVWCYVEKLNPASRTLYVWKVTVWGNDGVSTGEAESFWETGLMSPGDWVARWIEPEQTPVYHEPEIDLQEMFAQLRKYGKIPCDYSKLYPCPYLRKEFTLRKPLKKARIYATAHGLYRLEVNGIFLSEEFAPGFTPYDKYLVYQTIDATAALRQGKNAIGAILADGWYAGRIGGSGDNAQYGDMLGLLLQLEIEYEDGSRETIVSDGGFKSSFGPLQYSDIFLGEKYDARLALNGWSCPGYDDSSWTHVSEKDYPMDNLAAQYGQPVAVKKTIPAVSVITTPKGETVIDFGQVIAGRVRMKVRGERGTAVVLEHSEVLDENGNFLNNIFGRYKDQMDVYILSGQGDEEYVPMFTFHGFRYVRVTGYPGRPELSCFSAQVLTTDMGETGSFECSNMDLNRLQQNIYWSLVGNTLSIPTDCPQRERAGWTGDAQIITPTLCFNLDAPAFLGRYLRMMRMEQLEDGQVPIVIPFIPSYHGSADMPFAPALPGNETSAGWGDACTIIPWALYNIYGDIRFLRDNYEMMRRWVEYIKTIAENYNPDDIGEITPERRERLKYLWNANFHFGDWLAPSVSLNPETGEVDMERSAVLTMHYVPAAFFARSTELLCKAAEILGYREDYEKYKELHEKIKDAFAYEYIDEKGRLKVDMQGFHVLALHFGLVPQEHCQAVARRLVELIEENGDRLDTGFVSVPYLLDVLQDNGYLDKAYTLLYQDECPSWLYEVRKGATTIWESWQGILPNGKVGKDSFNHFAFGCVGDWMYRNLLGIRMCDEGYKKIIISPLPDSGLKWVKGSYHSVYGKISVDFNLEKQALSVHIPANTAAEVWIPGANVTENGIEAEKVDGVREVKSIGNWSVVTVGSGYYDFSFQFDSCFISGTK